MILCSGTMVANTQAQAELLAIRELVVSSTVALGKWPQVVDHIVRPGESEAKFKKLYADGQYTEAVLYSLRVWHGYGEERADLVKVLQAQGLNALAQDIVQERSLAKIIREHGSTCVNAAAAGLRLWFNIDQLIENFTGRLAELELLHAMLMKSKNIIEGIAAVISITGLGGVGKSTLARKYAVKFRRHYDGNVVWINAESVGSMRASFTQLSTHLGLPVHENQPNSELVAAVHEKIGDRKCLFVFDNVEEKKVFTQFRWQRSNPENLGPWVLITSRRDDLTQLRENKLFLDVLTSEEAVKFVRQHLPEPPHDDLLALTEQLQRLPLALQQAVAYIEDAYPQDSDSVREYLNTFRNSELDLLKDERFHRYNNYSLVTFTTWNVTLSSINKIEGGELAKKIIQILAYLNPDFITKQFVGRIFEINIAPSLRLLQKFSMIRVSSEGKVGIHRLVQQVIKLSLSAEEEVTIVLQILKHIKPALCQLQFTELAREGALHAQILFPVQIQRPEQLMRDESLYVSNLYFYLRQYGNYPEVLSFASKAVEVYEALDGVDHENTLRMYWRLADIHIYMENFSDAQQLLDSLIPVAVSGLGKEHMVTLDMIFLRALIKSKLGDHDGAITMHDEVLPLQSKLLGEAHLKVLITQSNKAIALRELGRLDEALALFQYVYEKKAEQFGTDDLKVVLIKWHIADTLFKKRELKKAVALYEEVHEVYRRLVGEANPDTKWAKADLDIAAAELWNSTTVPAAVPAEVEDN